MISVNVVWSSTLSDYNNIIASNMFINNPTEYFFWSEKFRIEDLKSMDIISIDAMNKVAQSITSKLMIFYICQN